MFHGPNSQGHHSTPLAHSMLHLPSRVGSRCVHTDALPRSSFCRKPCLFRQQQLPTCWHEGLGCAPSSHRRRRAACRASASSVQEDAPSPAAAAPVAAPAAAPLRVKGGKRKLRLDELCLLLHPTHSRNVLQSWILQGKVLVDNRVVTKAGQQVSSTAHLELLAEEPRFVCRGGLKLDAALLHFGISVVGKVALDSGQSTGGFSDCLLQHGAAKVIGVDVGYGQLHDKIRRDERVVVIERFNVRYIQPKDVPCKVDFVTLDLSFISVLKVVPALLAIMQPDAQMLVLIKPQFEAGRQQVGAGGLVKDPEVHKEVVARVSAGIVAMGMTCLGHMESPIRGDKSGNIEFLAHFVRGVGKGPPAPASGPEPAVAAAAPTAAAPTAAAPTAAAPTAAGPEEAAAVMPGNVHVITRASPLEDASK